MGNWIYFHAHSNPCPVCNGERSDCRQNKTSKLIHCLSGNDAPIGLRYIGEDKLGFGMYGEGDRDRSDDWREQLEQRNAQRERDRQRKLSWLMPVAERDRHYRSILASLTLHPADRADLLRRGFTDADIARIGFKSVEKWQKLDRSYPQNLPGIGRDGRSLAVSGDGYLCPVRNADGLIVGCQLRVRNVSDGGKYKWLSSDSNFRLPNDEPPLHHAVPTIEGDRQWLGFAEGTGAKPNRAAIQLGCKVLGAAGGNFASSPQQVKAAIASGLIPVLLPDAGAVSNPHVMGQYAKLGAIAPNLKVLWWGQRSKADGDVDEISIERLQDAKLISWAEFTAIADLGKKRIRNPRRDGSGAIAKIGATFRSLLGSQRATPLPVRGFDPVADSVAIEYNEGDRLRLWQRLSNQGFKYILDQSQTGSGKSFDAGNINPDEFGIRQAIYASAEHRNPTNETLSSSNGWTDLEARHDGLTRDDKNRLRRKKRGESYVVPPNCNRTRLIGALRAKNITGADSSKLVCGGCPLKEACQHSQGNGYGFLNQRRDALSGAKLRSHPDSLPVPSEYAYNESLILWDETGEIFKNRATVEVYQHDLEAVITRLLQADQLAPIQELLSALLTLFAADKKRYGVSHQSILNELPNVDDVDIEAIAQTLHPDLSILNSTAEYGVDLADLPRSVRRQFAERDATKADEVEQRVLKQWLPDLLRILRGELPGAMLHLDKLKLSISLPDERHRAIAKAAKCNVFLDATLTRDDLALKLGCDPSEIAVTKQRTVDHGNIDRIQIADLGRMGMQRGSDQERRLEALISYFKTVDPNTKAIDFKKFNSDGAWWVDSRGVNDFQDCKTLILVGTPCRNLNDLIAEYAALAGYVPMSDDDRFKAFCDRRIAADMVQGDGRPRANRRPDEDIQIIYVTNFNLPFEAEQVRAVEVCPEAGTKTERLVAAAKRAYDQLTEQGAKITQTAIAKAVGYSQQRISAIWNLLLLLIESLNSKSGKNPEHEEMVDVVSAIATESPPNEALDNLSTAFLDWIPPDDRVPIFQRLSPIIQQATLSALMGSLPIAILEASS